MENNNDAVNDSAQKNEPNSEDLPLRRSDITEP